MNKKEISYCNDEGQVVKEKLMLMYNESGNISINEADYNALYHNIEEIYHWSLQGKEIYEGWIKVFQTDNAISKLVQMIRQARTQVDFVREVKKKFKISNDSAEAIANLSLSELTGLTIDSIIHRFNYYSHAVEQLRPLIDFQLK